ncbi:MAG: Unknown protein [uncultured Thiotrichaceae bacterium]|uniref:Lipoprotein n=1 Tax=uncultured Thiotrichaceae bacterium TaxID=298394 RepID=A0A6S6SKW7_9GAMM|nr:MAG: Unknown protein [uncultured Thiotrichaceae bacterium]
MNRNAIKLLGVLITSFFIVACNPVAPTTTVKVYKAQGSISCDPGSGTSLTAMSGILNKSGIAVRSAHCGSDGLVRAAVCGVSTGKLNVYEIDASDLNSVIRMGFKKVELLKDYKPGSC